MGHYDDCYEFDDELRKRIALQELNEREKMNARFVRISEAIENLTDSFNEKATELIAILKKLDKTYEYPYPEEKVWSNGSGVEGEQESKSMFKETDCFKKENDGDKN